MKKIIRFLVALLCILLLPVNAAAHSGRTDANGGHHDYKNKSGLGSYHYHCGGNPPHLHPDGICPYGNNAEDSQPVYTPPSPSVKITDYPKDLNVGDTKGIEYTIENASSSQTSVVSSDENVVRVNEDRTLTAVGEGTAVITISGSGASETFKVTVKSVPVQSVSIHNLPERLQLDTTAAAAAVISPDNATDKSIGWSSSDENIAEVDQAGKVTAKRTGTATITCRTQNGIEAQVPLEIFEVFPEEIKTDTEEIRLEGGKSRDLDVQILPDNTNNKEYQITVADTNIAQVKNGNNICALNDGETEIIIQAGNHVSKRISVTVYHIPASQVEIYDDDMDYIYPSFLENALDINSEIELSARVYPDDATFSGITWESSDPEVISVSDGKLEIQGTGDVVLTARNHDEMADSIELKIVSEKAITGIMVGSGALCLVIGGTIVVFLKKRKKNLTK